MSAKSRLLILVGVDAYREGASALNRNGWCCRFCHHSFTRYRHPRITFARLLAHRLLRHGRFFFTKPYRYCRIQHASEATYTYTVTISGPTTWIVTPPTGVSWSYWLP